MPDTRFPPPVPGQYGAYDDPPAGSTASTPRSRRPQLQHALRATAEIDATEAASQRASAQPPFRSLGRWDSPRRRQRSPGPNPRDSSGNDRDAEDNGRRRYKRRRLDPEQLTPTGPPIKYGHYGQVEPGRLKLQVVSCDGGEHKDSRHPDTYLGFYNVLRHDKSVYCSERPDANIVLRHADNTPFCLEKLYIAGPEHGFTAPVREGLVVVAMTMNDLNPYLEPPPHARRHDSFLPPYRPLRSSPERLSLSEALRDPEVSHALDARVRNQTSAHAHPSNHPRSLDADEDDSSGQSDAESSCENPSVAYVPYISSESDLATLPIALVAGEEPGPEDSSSQEVIDFRLRRLRGMRRRLDMETWDHGERWAGASGSSVAQSNDGRNSAESDGWGSLRHLDALMARSRVDSPQRTEPGVGSELLQGNRTANEHDSAQPRHGFPPPAYDAKTAASDSSPFSDPNVTRARFYIRTSTNKVAIKFNPPISGRFILLKLHSNRGNVDVQSVIAKGYGGGRFFPALDLR